MFKFFRKYNRVILPVGIIVLMVLFLIGPAIQFAGVGQGDADRGHVGERTIRESDIRFAARDVDLLGALRQELPLINAQLLPSGDAFEVGLQWMLMLEEARGLGIESSRAQGEQTADEMVKRGFLEMLRTVSPNSKITRDDIVRAWQDYLAVEQLHDVILGVTRVRGDGFFQEILAQSRPGADHLAYDRETEATVEFVTISADLLLEEAGEPTEAEITELYDTYRASAAGTGEPLGLGYQRPASVKLAYLTIPVSRVAASIDIDTRDVQRHYREHQAKYVTYVPAEPEAPLTEPDGAETPTDPEATEAPTTMPAGEFRQKTISEAKDEIVEELRQQRAVTKIATMVLDAQSWLKAERQRAMAATETSADGQSDEKGYWVIREGYVAPDFEALANYLQQTHEVQCDVVRLGQSLIGLTEIDNLDGIGGAYLEKGEAVYPASYYIASVRELEPPEVHLLLERRLQTDVAGDPLRDADGNWYLFRVMDSAPQRAPTSLDEVREEVIRDAKQVRAYRKLLEAKDQYLATAKEEGLAALAEQVGETVQEPALVTRRQPLYAVYRTSQGLVQILLGMQPTSIEGIGRADEVVREVFDTVSMIEQAGGWVQAPESYKFAAAAVDHLRSLCVVRMTDLKQFSTPELEQRLPDLLSDLDRIDLYASLQGGGNPFTLEAVAERVGYRPITDGQSGKNAEEPDASGAESTAEDSDA
ncbi:MAG: hypothetical protein CMJ49_12530 [Planctomycetaceae bacterium]|nr:hypothetical protein [Planctomycetaceae bacterium]